MTAFKSIVVAGAGQAGHQTAALLRQDGYDGAISLIGDEPGLPYQRPPLSKAFLLGKTTAAALAFRPEKFFIDNKIQLINDQVTGLDRTNHRVTLRKGAPISFDHLVLAVGVHNRTLPVPGADLEGVYSLRTLAHAEVLAVRLKQAKNIVIAGAGFIGLEFAAVARSVGANVTVLELADRLMARAVSKEMSQFFLGAHSDAGVDLHLGQGLARIDGAGGKITGVELTNGQKLPADLLVVAVGVLPNIQLAAEAGLDIENGVKVDSYLLTSDPTISAIGDCASFPSQLTGDHVRLESVQNAIDQGRAVAARLVGKAAPYSAVPWFWSDQGDLKLQMVGLCAGYDATVTLGNPAEKRFTVLLFKRGHLIAVESVNRAGDFMAARKMMSRQSTLSPNDAAAPGFELRAWEAAGR